MMMQIRVLLVGAIVAVSINMTASAQQTSQQNGNPWSQCCGMEQWPMGPDSMGPGMMGRDGMNGMAGSMPRHRQSMMSGVPAPYDRMANPLPRTRATLDRGATVYADNCASCHGPTGRGDGEGGRELSPPPANLAWLSRMPMVQWDSFMFWAVAEGGTAFGTAMPAFKDILSKDDIWAVIAYIQARLPQPAQPTP